MRLTCIFKSKPTLGLQTSRTSGVGTKLPAPPISFTLTKLMPDKLIFINSLTPTVTPLNGAGNLSVKSLSNKSGGKTGPGIILAFNSATKSTSLKPFTLSNSDGVVLQTTE